MEKSQAGRRIPWTRFGFEGVLIIVSILAAFGIDAWWTARGELKEGSSLQAALASEFEAVGQELGFSVSRNEMIIAAADTLLQQLRREAPSVEVASGTLGALLLTPTTDSVHGTLDTLIASGRLDLLPNKSLQFMLADWPALLDDVREEEFAAKDFVHEQLTPYLGRVTDLSPIFVWRIEERQERRNAGTVSEKIKKVPTSLPTDPVLINLIETRRYLASYVLTNYVFLQSAFEQISVELAK